MQPFEDDVTKTTPPSHEYTGSAFVDTPSGSSLGRYRILRMLGEGGMGRVFEAEDTESARRVALKISHPGFEASHRSALLREARLAASVSHPNCVFVFESSETAGLVSIAMELVQGGTLKERVRTAGSLDPEDAVRITLDILNGLDAAHRKGILHRDVKPANVFIDEITGTAKIGDFGISLLNLAPPVGGAVVPPESGSTGTFAGTPAFASPEQLRGDSFDLRSDIYSLGATLFFMLTGRAAFAEDDMIAMVASIATRPAVPPSKFNPKVSEELDNVVLRCLAKSPADRFPDYASLREALTPGVPAPVGSRFAAWLIDTALIGFAMTLLYPTADASREHLVSKAALAQTAFAILLTLVAGVAEGRWGVSPGKFLLGLRVRRNLAPPGWTAGLIRGGVYAGSQYAGVILTMICAMTTGWDTQSPSYSFANFVAGMSGMLIFLSARPSNHWTGLHDRLSRSRVTQKRSRRSDHKSLEANSAPPALAIRQLGPFEVARERDVDLHGQSVKLLDAWDRVLGRSVWILEHQVGTHHPAIGDDRKNLQRPGRLRWITGRHSAEAAWDAYEAPDGTALLDLGTTPIDGRRIPAILASLSSELELGEETLDLSRVWISTNNRCIVCDFPVDGKQTPALAGRKQALRECALRLISGPAPMLPSRLNEILRGVESGAVLFPQASEHFLRLPSCDARVSRVRRLAQVSISHLGLICFAGINVLAVLPKPTALAMICGLLLYFVLSIGSPFVSGRPFSFVVTGLAFSKPDGTRAEVWRILIRLALPVTLTAAFVVAIATTAAELAPMIPPAMANPSRGNRIGQLGRAGFVRFSFDYPWAFAMMFVLPSLTFASSIWSPYRGFLDRLTGLSVCRK